MKYYTRDTEAGNIIEEFASMVEAKAEIAKYEIADKEDGVFIPNFYEVYISMPPKMFRADNYYNSFGSFVGFFNTFDEAKEALEHQNPTKPDEYKEHSAITEFIVNGGTTDREKWEQGTDLKDYYFN